MLFTRYPIYGRLTIQHHITVELRLSIIPIAAQKSKASNAQAYEKELAGFYDHANSLFTTI